ncbi:MAG: ribosome small subunit-dependent GTPase A [Spirochaetia bacterium]|nr:ribosome small subunit-dependent GTPase A [Spirochaetia bacterium]
MKSKILTAQVVAVFGAYLWVKPQDSSNKILRAKPRGKLRIKNRGVKKNLELSPQHIFAIGDIVTIQIPEEKDEKGIEAYIIDIEPRKNIFQRASFYRLQTLAANLDVVVIISSVKIPSFNHGFIDRVLVETENSNLKAVIVINKIDTIKDKKSEFMNNVFQKAGEYEKLGYDVFYESFITGKISIKLINLLRNKLTILNGQSGVGKSTLLNILAKENLQATAEVGVSMKGKHTTTNPILYEIENNIEIIDVPGIREFGLHHKKIEDIKRGFIEFQNYACQHENCNHYKEAQCAVKEALEKKEISDFRYSSYINIIKSLEETHKPRKGDFRGL